MIVRMLKTEVVRLKVVSRKRSFRRSWYDDLEKKEGRPT